MPSTYDSLLSARRLRPSSITNRTLATETDSDYGRVLFSAALRRLQQKTQVFPLEDNAAVRSRLTHSLEVAYIGRLIALQIIELAETQDKSKTWGLSSKEIPFRNTVETACLAHDIGNPPFGHFGEHAIQDWFRRNCTSILRKSIKNLAPKDFKYFRRNLLPDFLNFDGNAQGFRIFTRLQWNIDEYSLNLTISQLAAFLKYTRAPNRAGGNKPFQKKPGFFLTEKPIVDDVWKSLGLSKNQRHPLAYVVEASDDIAYCVSDIEDALEKGLADEDEFRSKLESIWAEQTKKEQIRDTRYLPNLLKKAWKEVQEPAPKNSRFFAFKTKLTRDLTKKSAELYIENHDSILRGEAPALLDRSPQHKAALDSLKRYAQEHIFRSPDAEHLELAGFQVVRGLLEHLSPLLALPRSTFDSVSAGKRLAGTDLERRLYNLLPQKHILVYKETLRQFPKHLQANPKTAEWFARAHLIVDFISGMTDRYALETYQLLSGIRV